ncbi:MAG: hypothetical protein J6C52_14010 [Clostridia bacterium]|nr:hypothetical protein [Clostridia bacterium]
MNEVAARDIFDYCRLNRARYTLSLASEAFRCGLCTAEQFDALQLAMYERLAVHIHLYTGGRSASVENRIASQLLGSILHNTDLALMRMKPEEAVARLFSSRFDALVGEGMALAGEYSLKALSRLREAGRCRVPAIHIFYNRLYDMLKELIRTYDIRFDAARVLVDVDYRMPTVNRQAPGICGMLHLLDELIAENRFVLSFGEAEREALFDRWHREIANPTACTVNLGALCFEQALLCIMVGKQPGTLLLTPEDCTVFTAMYTGDIAYERAVSLVHKLADRAPERYLMRLLADFRAQLTIIAEGGAASVRRYAGIK